MSDMVEGSNESANARVIDFDAWRREQKKEPVLLILGGREYMLPADLPADVALEIIEMKQKHGDADDVPPEVMARLGEGLFGEIVWKAIVKEHHVGIYEVGWLVQQALRAYNQEVKAPNRQTRRVASKRKRSR